MAGPGQSTKILNHAVLSTRQVQQVASLIRLRENLHLRFLPGGGKTSVLRHFSENINLINYIEPHNLSRITFIKLDLNLTIDTGKYLLEDYFEISVGTRNLIAGLNKLIQEERYIYLALDNFDARNPEFLDYLIALEHSNGSNLRFLIVGDISTFNELSPKMRARYASILQNPIDVPYFSDELARQFVKASAERLGMQPLTEAQLQMALRICGGNPYLLKNFLQLSRSYPDLEETFNSNRFRELVAGYVQKLSPREQLIIKNYAYNGKLLKLEPTLSDLRQLGLIASNAVRGYWYKQLTHNANASLALERNTLTYDGINFEHHFTPTELSLLKAFVFVKGEILSRDDIAHLIWGANADSSYSSWAIDKNISRLRKKLNDLGVANEIETEKKRGYRLK